MLWKERLIVNPFVYGRTGNFPGYALPPSMNPVAVKKLIEKRNERFSQAVNEYVNQKRHPPLSTLLDLHMTVSYRKDCS